MPGPGSGSLAADIRAPGMHRGRVMKIAAMGTTAAAVMTLAETYGGQLTVTGGPTVYVFKIGRFKKLIGFMQWNSQGTNGSKTQKPVQSFVPNPAAGTVTVTWDTTIANSIVSLEFTVIQ